ncbi:MAG: L,D-transpeptidase [Chitinophagaceae bacterium]
MYKYFTSLFLLVLITVLSLSLFSCGPEKRKNFFSHFKYQRFKDSLQQLKTIDIVDSSNFFDENAFVPGTDSFQHFLWRMDSLWQQDLANLLKEETKRGPLINRRNEKLEVMSNIKTLDSFLNRVDSQFLTPCVGIECALYAVVDKSKQLLYLYLEGELSDSFKVSTGIKKYETPEMDLQARGPVFTKYKSRKYPGGNYMGLGNMPYAVFLRDGYAIHGTTLGNFKKLGTRASHGCIRIHPDNALIFYSLVKKVGLSQTWVTVRDRL